MTSLWGQSPEAYVAVKRLGQIPILISHEYYHLVQHRTVLAFADGPRSAPGWLIEGTAAYAEIHYNTHVHGLDEEFAWQWESFASRTPFADVLENNAQHGELGADGLISGGLVSEFYDLAAAGVAWLVSQSGDERSHVEYWRLLAETDNWEQAFTSAFGMTVGDFLEGFEAYRDERRTQVHAVSGSVVDLEGVPVGGAPISLTPLARGAPVTAITTDDGTFTINAVAGQYFLWFGFIALAIDPESGNVNKCGPLDPLEVSQGDVSGIVVRVDPELLTRGHRPVCNEGLADSVLLSGRVLGPDSEPVEAVIVCAAGDGPSDRTPCTRTESDGTFTLSVREGTVWLRVSMEGGPSGWYGDGRWVSSTSRRTAIHVGSADVRGLEVRMPAILYGMVIGPDGDPPPFSAVLVCAEHAAGLQSGCVPVFHLDGTFEIAVPDGGVSLEVWLRGRPIGWYGNGGVVTDEAERAVIPVDGANVEGIEIQLP